MLKKIREYLHTCRADALFVPHTDAFLSEYLTPDNERLCALTGFSGSAGVAVVTQKQAVLFTDSRYTDQARQQTHFQVINIAEQSPIDWMKKHLSGGRVVFHDGTMRAGLALSVKEVLLQNGIEFIPMTDNWIDLFWHNRPIAKPIHTFSYPKKYAGLSRREKTTLLTQHIQKMDLDGLVLSDLESVSWLLNLRSDLSSYLPVVRRRVLVDRSGKIITLSQRTIKRFQGKKMGVDLNSLPFDLYQKIKSHAVILPIEDPVAFLRAVKNPIEQKALRQTCLFESAVICTFIDTIYRKKTDMSEVSAGALLQKLRRQASTYLGDSFAPIVAVGVHAALAHYQADKNTDVSLNAAPMVLVDTGGQYLGGTTDMTRTLCVGRPTSLMKKRYTQVLQGHIALAQTILKAGEPPASLDMAARQFLRADGVDYGHATGHGIGMCLSVHDKLPVIYEKSKTPLRAGMLFSNEPGFYDFQKGFGIRLENMILTQEKNGYLTLDNLIFVPFEPQLVQVELLNAAQREWLRTYHLEIEQRVFPLLKKSVAHRLQPVIDFFKAL